MAVGAQLRRAREQGKLTLRQIEARTGIGESSLSEFENEKREPRLSQLELLAKVYRRPLAYFLSEDITSPELVLWRERPSEDTASDIERQFVELCNQYHNLEMWLDEHSVSSLPLFEDEVERFQYKDADRLAYSCHKALGLGERPAQNLLTVLEEFCGVKIFHLPFEPTGTAACTVHESFGFGILLNTNNVRWRRNFDLAHELFHLLTWKVFRSDQADTGNLASDIEERFANRFASSLLIPSDAARVAIDSALDEHRISYEDMFDIARQFDVSFEALIWRMVSLGYFSADQARNVIHKYREISFLGEDERRDDSPPPRPPRFRALAIRALRQGEMSLGRFAEYLGLRRHEAKRFLEQDALENETVETPPS